MKVTKMLATIVYAVSLIVCIIPLTGTSLNESSLNIESQVKKENEVLAEIERDDDERPQVEKSEDIHCDCDHPNHDYQNLSICDEIYGIYDYDDVEEDPSAYDSGDYSPEEIKEIEKRLGY